MTEETRFALSAPPALDQSSAALFLDFDGTLVDIAPRPDAVEVAPGLGAALNRLRHSLDGALALVSGRSLAVLEQFLPDFDGLMIGSHGAEARGMAPMIATAPEGLAMLQAMLAQFAQEQGLFYEEKTLGGALHFRARPEAAPTAEAFVTELAMRLPGFTVQPAKMCFELKPEGASKDRALARIVQLPAFAGRLPIYLGDDSTDEPALAWAAAQGGFGVKIGAGPSVARHRLADPVAVRRWLGLER